MRISRLFPVSILNILLSKKDISIIDQYRSAELEEYFGDHSSTWSKELELFLYDLADSGTKQQRQFKKVDRTWVARRVYEDAGVQKFLLVLMKR